MSYNQLVEVVNKMFSALIFKVVFMYVIMTWDLAIPTIHYFEWAEPGRSRLCYADGKRNSLEFVDPIIAVLLGVV